MGPRSGQAEFELSLTLSQQGRYLVGVLEYAADLYECTTAERMIEHWQRLLESAVEEPDRRLCDLEALGRRERNQLLYEWNQTEVEEGAGGALGLGLGTSRTTA